MNDEKTFFVLKIFIYIKKIIILFKYNNVKEIPLILSCVFFYMLFILSPLSFFYLVKYYFNDLLLWENAKYIIQDIFLMSLLWSPIMYLSISFFPIFKEGDVLIKKKEEFIEENMYNIFKIENNQYYTVSRSRPDVLVKIKIEDDHLYQTVDLKMFNSSKNNVKKENIPRRKFKIIHGEKK